MLSCLPSPQQLKTKLEKKMRWYSAEYAGYIIGNSYAGYTHAWLRSTTYAERGSALLGAFAENIRILYRSTRAPLSETYGRLLPVLATSTRRLWGKKNRHTTRVLVKLTLRNPAIIWIDIGPESTAVKLDKEFDISLYGECVDVSDRT